MELKLYLCWTMLIIGGLLGACSGAPPATVEPPPPTVSPSPPPGAANPDNPEGAASDLLVTPAPPDCFRQSQHPHALEMAEMFDTTYEEVAGWVCAGFGFGDVKRAYRASAQTEFSVGEVLSLVIQMNGDWPEVEHRLGIGNTSDD